MNAVVTASVLLGILAYGAFLVFCIVNLARGVTGQALLLAGTTTLLWLLSIMLPTTREFYLVLEPIAIASWTVLLVRALGLSMQREQPAAMRPVQWTFGTAIMVSALSSLTALLAAFELPLGGALTFHLTLLVVNVLGLVLVEQLAQNSVTDFRWRIRYLNIGLGMMYVFGLVHHALAILLQGPVLILSALQPAVMALMVPFMVVASLRNRTNRLRFSLSRNFVFRTGVLVSTGAFLLALGVFGYLAQLFAGDIGITIAVFLGIAAVTFFLIVVGSSRFRSQLRVVLSKTFFEYRYDYRDEWIKVTAQLTEPDVDFDLAQQAQRAILSILHARHSCLWLRDDEGVFRPLSNIEASSWMEPIPAELGSAVDTFYASHNWVLDLNDMPEVAQAIAKHIQQLPDADKAHYLVPLFVERQLFGLCLIGASEIPLNLVWEDFDIIKLISTQCAGFLALQGANQNLIEREQLAAVNQMSAFLLHDVKTIAAQLSLMLENAPRHRDNPAFIDDMLKTTQNSVERMQRIIAGLRTPNSKLESQLTELDLADVLRDRSQNPALKSSPIEYEFGQQGPMVKADRDALDIALTHLEQNALDATKNNGRVRVIAAENGQWAHVRVSDDGIGMSEEFIKNELFTPFRSNKGLSGMGIGAYQARAKIRSCGGDLQVESKLGVGTTFTIKLPLLAEGADT